MAITNYTFIPEVLFEGPGVTAYLIADTEAELPTNVSDGTLCFAKDTNKLYKRHSSAWNDTAGGTAAPASWSRTFLGMP